ncbi:MAG: tetratricopeptide repeat protein [Lewinellaceae bacterium]|nr:tetratricopeptide repeat protein [Lewinellaceae bacterium]
MNVKIKERLLESGSAAMAPALSLLAEAYRNLEEYQLVLEAQQKILVIQRQSLAPTNPAFAASHAGLAAIYRGMGEYGMVPGSPAGTGVHSGAGAAPNHPDIARSYEVPYHLPGGRYTT